MLNLLLATAFVLVQQAAPPAASRNVGKITGIIVESRSGAPLSAVLVKVEATGQQAFTDEGGQFVITNVPIGAQTLLVSVIGYGLVRRDVAVDGTSDAHVAIPVTEGASTYVEDVSVRGSAFREGEEGVATQSVLGSRELLALRGLIADDPFRAVQVLPGVATGDDFRAEFALRGLGPNHVGISIDGVDSPLLYHTVRAVHDTGSLALINSDLLESATLLAGPHPERLNSHLGSRVDLTTRDGSRERLTVRGLVSASAASTVWEGPLGTNKKASWLFAARRSYIDWLLQKIDSTSGVAFGFTDAQAKLAFDPSPRQSLRVSMIAGHSTQHEQEDSPSPNSLEHGINNSFVGNIQWRFTPSATFSTTQQIYLVHSGYRNLAFDGRARNEGSDRDVTWHGAASWNPRAGHFIELGGQAQSLHARRVDRAFTATTAQLLVDTAAGTASAAGWVQYRWTPSTRLTLTPGLRLEHWQLFDQSKASPWLLLEFAVAAGTRLRVGGAVQHQAPSIDDAHSTLPGQTLLPERAATIEAGFEQRFGSSWRLSLSAYRRRDDDRLRLVDSEFRIANNRIVGPVAPHFENALTGDSNGAQIVIERRAVGGLNGWLSYAWSDSTLDDPGRAGHPAESFPADFDQRHTVNAYVGYRWSGRTSLSARYRFGSNFPIVGYVGQDASGYVLSTQRNVVRLPAYSRLDVRADRSFTYRTSRLTLFIETINLLNHENVRPTDYGVSNLTRRVFDPFESVFPIMPVAGVMIEF